MPTTQKRRFGILLEACSVAWGRLTDGGSICRNLKNRKKRVCRHWWILFIPQTALRPSKSEEVISTNPPTRFPGRLHGPVAHIGRVLLSNVQHAPSTHYQPQRGRGADCPARWCAPIKSRRRRSLPFVQLLWRRPQRCMNKSVTSSLLGASKTRLCVRTREHGRGLWWLT